MPQDAQSVRGVDVTVAVGVPMGDARGFSGEADDVPQDVERINGVEGAAAVDVTA